MPTTTVKSIGTSSRDYSTITSWEAALPADLTSSDEVWKGECYNDAEFTDTDIDIDGTTTDATRYVWLTTATGQSFIDHADKLTNALKYNQSNGVGVNSTAGGSYVGMIRSNENYTIVEKLQFKGGGYKTTWASSTGCSVDCGGTSTIFRNCIFENSRSIRLVNISGTAKVVNCLIVKTGTVGSAMPVVNFRYPSAGSVLAASTIVIPSDISGTNWRGVQTNSSNALVTNCAVFGAATGFNGTFNASSGYIATDNSTAPGSNNQTSLTYADQFEDTANSGGYDFRAKSTGSLDTNGTRDQTNTNDLDIIGQSRSTSTPTIGCWEVVAAGGDEEAALTGSAVTGGHGSAAPGISVSLKERLRHRFISLPGGLIVPRFRPT